VNSSLGLGCNNGTEVSDNPVQYKVNVVTHLAVRSPLDVLPGGNY
jgi:hypothetical protein